MVRNAERWIFALCENQFSQSGFVFRFGPQKQEFCTFHGMGYNDEVWEGFVRTCNEKTSPDCYVEINSQVRKDYSLFAYKDGKMFAFQFFGELISE